MTYNKPLCERCRQSDGFSVGWHPQGGQAQVRARQTSAVAQGDERQP